MILRTPPKFSPIVTILSLGLLLNGCGPSSDSTVTKNSSPKTTTNQAPQITSSPIVTATDDSKYQYQLVVTDPDDQNDGQQLTFNLSAAPTGMTVSDRGLIEWTPNLAQSASINVTINVSDGGENGAAAASQSFQIDVAALFTMTGRTIDYFTGQAVANTKLTISSGSQVIGQATSTSNGDYSVQIQVKDIASRTTVNATVDGYAQASRTISNLSSNRNQVMTLIPVLSQQTFDSSLAKNLTVDNQDIVSLPAQSLAQANGDAPQGDVTAQLTIIDPSIDISIMPGDMLTLSNDLLTPIESFGAINVVFKDEAGNKLNLKSGQTATINIPVASNIASAPATMPLYYYDELAGLWVKEGQATLITTNGQRFYQGNVTHFTTWNADIVYQTVTITGCVTDSDSVPIANAILRSAGRSYNGTSSATSDSNGLFSITGRYQSSLLLSAVQGQQSRTLVIETLDDNKSLTDCLVLSPAISSITLSWGEHPEDLDSHFYGPTEAQDAEFHLDFIDQTVTVAGTSIFLDVDDTSSFGPEVVTIPKFPLAGRYHYLVDHYYGDSNIKTSPTRVELNLESDITIYSPPTGDPTDIWHVFDFVVDSQGTVTIEPVNRWLTEMSQRHQTKPTGQEAPAQVQATPTTGHILKRAIAHKYYAD